MPYKDKQKARESWYRWYKRNRKKHNQRKRINYDALKTYPIPRECSIKGCTKIGVRHHPNYTSPKEIIWLCKRHHAQLHFLKHRKCSLKGCNNQHAAKGYCMLHYGRMRYSKIKQAKLPDKVGEKEK